MKGIFIEELSRAFRNRRLWIVAALAVGSLAVGIYRRNAIFGPQAANPVNLWMMVAFYTPFTFLAALLSTLPFADSLLDDRNHGYLRMVVLRAPYRQYLAAKTLAVGLVGGASTCGSVLLMAALLTLIGPVDFAARGYISNSTIVSTAPWGALGWLYTVSPYGYLAFLLATTFVFGVVYALLGLALSTLVNNRYVVLAAPLIFFQVLSYLEERANHIPPAWNPTYALFPFDAYQGPTLAQQAAQYGLLLVGAALCLAFFGRKARMLG